MGNPIPKMAMGSILSQWKRCGRATCHCTHGALHGPYFYQVWYEGGLLRKRYIRLAAAASMRAACAERRQVDQERRRELREARQAWQHLTAGLREVEHHA